MDSSRFARLSRRANRQPRQHSGSRGSIRNVYREAPFRLVRPRFVPAVGTADAPFQGFGELPKGRQCIRAQPVRLVEVVEVLLTPR